VGKLKGFLGSINAQFLCARWKSGRPDLRPAFAVTRFKRLHQGAQKGSATNLGSLSEPRRKQNLYANPKRTAKFSNNIFSDALRPEKVQTISKNFYAVFTSVAVPSNGTILD